ncbi:unnamed protein product [Soboliphyme baturini]|uniref:Transmembrane protein n=1 Tax=Soboliphyme baturini TaxID=241478 RepID=A0A183IVB1_9BILA|nr:unnamed protein product [Soboliphyme baturini]
MGNTQTPPKRDRAESISSSRRTTTFSEEDQCPVQMKISKSSEDSQQPSEQPGDFPVVVKWSGLNIRFTIMLLCLLSCSVTTGDSIPCQGVLWSDWRIGLCYGQLLRPTLLATVLRDSSAVSLLVPMVGGVISGVVLVAVGEHDGWVNGDSYQCSGACDTPTRPSGYGEVQYAPESVTNVFGLASR